ncbi:hypothetical protein CCO1648 [Campylobacter coli RM2228]|nr:hypothetical protein CCO1648 [Campylobacter coli RM2228]
MQKQEKIKFKQGNSLLKNSFYLFHFKYNNDKKRG